MYKILVLYSLRQYSCADPEHCVGGGGGGCWGVLTTYFTEGRTDRDDNPFLKDTKEGSSAIDAGEIFQTGMVRGGGGGGGVKFI